MGGVGQDTKYTYAVGRIRVLESRLLRREIFERMLGEEDPLLSLKLLSESQDYSKEVSDLKDLTDFETVIVRQLRKTHKIINELTKDKQITDLYMFKYDIHNVKTYLKTKFVRAVEPQPYIQLGLLTPDDITRLIKEEEFNELPFGVGDIVLDIIKKPDSSIDLVLDRFLYSRFWEYLLKFKNPFLLRLYKIDIDLKNIRIAIRLKIIRDSNIKIQEDFLEKGYLDKVFFRNTKEVSLEDFISIFKRTEYSEIIRDTIKNFEEEATLVRLERLSGNFIMNFIRKAKYFPFGIEPLIGYLLAKENETRTIKAIINGKVAGLPKDLIRERICRSYV